MKQSAILFERAQQVLVGGVNSPVRAFRSVGGTPLFVKSAQGARFVSADDETYLDYVLSWGPALLGHAYSDVVRAVQSAAENGLSFGAPCEQETTLALLVQSFFPSMEKIRFVNSGTEACMSAVRLARGFTGRPYIVKFEGCYHGHSDSMLVSAGSGGLTFGQPNSAGVPESLVSNTLVVPYNDVAALRACFAQYGENIAAVILEPICGNMGFVRPLPVFLEALVSLTKRSDSLIIFDEVMTGFRVDLGGAQALFGIRPDLTCLGKVVGGGLPCAAYGGRQDIMACLSPQGPVYQAGTLSGNPLAMAAGIATLSALQKEDHFRRASERVVTLMTGWKALAAQYDVPLQLDWEGTMFGFFFCKTPCHTLSDVTQCDSERFNRFFHAMLAQGVYFAPSQYEAGFMSSAHSEADISFTLSAISTVFSGW